MEWKRDGHEIHYHPDDGYDLVCPEWCATACRTYEWERRYAHQEIRRHRREFDILADRSTAAACALDLRYATERLKLRRLIEMYGVEPLYPIAENNWRQRLCELENKKPVLDRVRFQRSRKIADARGQTRPDEPLYVGCPARELHETGIWAAYLAEAETIPTPVPEGWENSDFSGLIEYGIEVNYYDSYYDETEVIACWQWVPGTLVMFERYDDDGQVVHGEQLTL